MPNIDITRPELVWPGKYDGGNRVENRDANLLVLKGNPALAEKYLQNYQMHQRRGLAPGVGRCQ